MALSVMYSVQLGCTVSPHGTVSHVQCTTGLHRQSTWHCQSCTVYNWAALSVHMALSVMYSVQLGCTVSPHGTVSHVQCTTGLHHQSTWHCQSCTVYNWAAPSVHMALSVMYSVQLCCTVSPHDTVSHVQCTTALHCQST